MTLRRLARARAMRLREGKAPPNCFLARDARINAMLPLTRRDDPPARTTTNNQGSYTGQTTALYLLFLAFAGTGGPLRFFEEDASFAARCACLKRSMLALLCTL